MRQLAPVLALALALAACSSADTKDNRKLNKGSTAPKVRTVGGEGDDDEATEQAAGSGSASAAPGGGAAASGSGASASGSTSSSGSGDTPASGDLGTDDGGDMTTTDPDAEVDPDDTLTYLNYAKAALDAKCVTCHANPAKNGAVIDLSAFSPVKAQLDRIKARIRQGDMPPLDSTPLAPADKKKLQGWINAGGAEGAPPVPQPGGHLVKPAALFSPTSNTEVFRVEAAFDNTTADSTWSAYYVLSPTDKNTDHPIVQDRAVASATYDWDTSAVTASAYYVYLVVKTGAKSADAFSTGTVLVNHLAAGNHNPTVSISAAWNGMDDAQRAFLLPADIAYTATDPDSGDTLTAKLEYLKGDTWFTAVDPNATANGSATSYHWDPQGGDKPEDGAAYKLRVTVEDGAGGKAIAQSEAVFGLASATYTYDADIKPLFGLNNGCAPCHDQNGGRAGLFRWDVFTPKGLGDGDFGVKALNRVLRTPNNPMPPAGATPELLKKLQLWEWQGKHES